MKFRDRLIAFLSGRYGTDQLNGGLLVLYLILLFVQLFTNSLVVALLMWAVVLWTLFRSLSRNFTARRKENAIFLKFWNPIVAFFSDCKMRIRDKEHVFRTCPHCRSKLRLPRKKGTHTVPCPRCGKRFDVKIHF